MPRKMPSAGRRVRRVHSLDETALELAKIRQAEGYREEQTISEETPSGKRSITLGRRGERFGPWGTGQPSMRKKKK